MVRTQRCHCQGLDSIPSPGTKIPLPMRCDQIKKKKKESGANIC